jgi:hypothetical protein
VAAHRQSTGLLADALISTISASQEAIGFKFLILVYQMSRGWLQSQGFLWLRQGGTALWLAAVVGCGATDGLNRQAISGTVTLDGQPISKGAILFEPATQESGTAVGATIREGSFAISRHEGPVPGAYLVRVYSSSGIQVPPAKGQTDRSPRPMVERLPPRYNTQTELRAKVVDRTGTPFRFDLISIGSTDLR